MRGPWRIARILGIDIFVDLSWFLIVVLMVYSFGFVEFPRELNPRSMFPQPDATSLALGIITSLLVFASVLAHELAHSWMAMERGIPVGEITLFIFGGVARITDEPDRPATEFLIAIMGPLMSLALATLLGAAWLWLRIAESAGGFGLSLLPLILLTGILFQSNGLLTVFNLLPGYPLDGGRVFRAILWGWMHDIRRATSWATRAGELVALLLGALGAWLLIFEMDPSGIWYALIGLFIWNAAREGNRQTILRDQLRGVTVGQLMTKAILSVSADCSVEEFMSRDVIPNREQTFVVSDGTVLAGIISAEELRLPRKMWTTTRVRDVMTPRAGLPALAPEQPALAALAHFAREQHEEAPVLSDGRVVGFLGRRELARFCRLRQ